MNYSSNVWGAKCYPKTDTLHNKIIRFYLGTNKCTSSEAIEGDMGWTRPSKIKLSQIVEQAFENE